MSRPKIETDEDLRKLIRASRLKASLTQEQAAARARVTNVWWSNIESGAATVTTLETIVRMCIAAKVSMRALYRVRRPDLVRAIKSYHDWFGSEAL